MLQPRSARTNAQPSVHEGDWPHAAALRQALRLERAEHQLGQGATMESAARDAGVEDARMLRRLRNPSCLTARGRGGLTSGACRSRRAAVMPP